MDIEKRVFSEELIQKARGWLGDDGLAFFVGLIEEHGKEWSVACWLEGGIPHSVHLREGMQVRNFIRESGLHDNLDAHHLDNSWGKLIEAVVKK